MMTRLLFSSTLILFVFTQKAIGEIQVISTTCQYKTKNGDLDWMTCPLKDGKRQEPNTFRQYQDDLASRAEDQKFCCGGLDARFCCSLDEKLREVPGFNPASHDDPMTNTSFEENWFGFWTWMILSALALLLFGLLIYMTSCIFVEVLDMIFYILCCCFRKKGRRDGYAHIDKAKQREYRGHERATIVNLVATPPQRQNDGNYPTIHMPPSNYGSTGGQGMYRNVTPNYQDVPPPYPGKA